MTGKQLFTIAALSAPLCWGAKAAAAPVDFVRDVRPIFEKHCTGCHGEKKQKSGLRLDVKAAALKGGDNHGPDIIPGKANESPLIHFLTTEDEDELMPPKGRLPAEEIAVILFPSRQVLGVDGFYARMGVGGM